MGGAGRHATLNMAAAAPVDAYTVLYQDDVLVAVDKPAGVLVHRSAESRERNFVLQTLARQLGRTLYPVHRLDRATSGVLLFALTSAAAARLQLALADPITTRKEYLALVRGSTPAQFICERPLTPIDRRDLPPQPARTEFEKLAEFARCSLIRARITSGRRHQIRRHLQGLAHQVIGDTSYGKGQINRALRAEFGLPRLFLHAERVTFVHPDSHASFTIHAPLAPDLRAFLLRLPDAPTELIGRL
ncbi:MAG: pseudouridine synthase [Planctomycetota bacterium]